MFLVACGSLLVVVEDGVIVVFLFGFLAFGDGDAW